MSVRRMSPILMIGHGSRQGLGRHRCLARRTGWVRDRLNLPIRGTTVSGRVARGLSPTAGTSLLYSVRRHGRSRHDRRLNRCFGSREPAWLNNATTDGEVAGVHSERCPVHRVSAGPGLGGRNALPILGPPDLPWCLLGTGHSGATGRPPTLARVRGRSNWPLSTPMYSCELC